MIKQFKKYIPKSYPSVVICLLLVTISCQSLKYTITNRDISKELKKSPIFNSHITGFTLYNPKTKSYLCNYNDSILYTPASNTKILTALACLTELQDSIASYKYSLQGDSIFIYPLGDPTFLNSKFANQKSIEFLKEKTVFISYPKTPLARYGAGWAWDDHSFNFQKERSWMPLYGNAVNTFRHGDTLRITPDFFFDQIEINIGPKPYNHISRAENINIFSDWLESDTILYNFDIPIVMDNELIGTLLQDTLGNTPYYVDSIPYSSNFFYSQSTKHVLSQMMLPSDNFLAEQLLIHCALMNGNENIDAYRNSLLKKWSSFLPQGIKWVDASGLSRYNLMSPKSIVAILNQIYEKEKWTTIEQIFPIGGQSGTLKKWYLAEEPYVIAKTGTLSNNHNLSGYLKTKSGKILIFSLMNNHYLRSTNEVKLEMENLLLNIRNAY